MSRVLDFRLFLIFYGGALICTRCWTCDFIETRFYGGRIGVPTSVLTGTLARLLAGFRKDITQRKVAPTQNTCDRRPLICSRLAFMTEQLKRSLVDHQRRGWRFIRTMCLVLSCQKTRLKSPFWPWIASILNAAVSDCSSNLKRPAAPGGPGHVFLTQFGIFKRSPGLNQQHVQCWAVMLKLTEGSFYHSQACEAGAEEPGDSWTLKQFNTVVFFFFFYSISKLKSLFKKLSQNKVKTVVPVSVKSTQNRHFYSVVSSRSERQHLVLKLQIIITPTK